MSDGLLIEGWFEEALNDWLGILDHPATFTECRFDIKISSRIGQDLRNRQPQLCHGRET